MLREIITPQSNEHTVHIPSEYINTRVEILVLPLSDTDMEEVEADKSNIFLKTAGLLHDKKERCKSVAGDIQDHRYR